MLLDGERSSGKIAFALTRPIPSLNCIVTLRHIRSGCSNAERHRCDGNSKYRENKSWAYRVR